MPSAGSWLKQEAEKSCLTCLSLLLLQVASCERAILGEGEGLINQDTNTHGSIVSRASCISTARKNLDGSRFGAEFFQNIQEIVL